LNSSCLGVAGRATRPMSQLRLTDEVSVSSPDEGNNPLLSLYLLERRSTFSSLATSSNAGSKLRPLDFASRNRRKGVLLNYCWYFIHRPKGLWGCLFSMRISPCPQLLASPGACRRRYLLEKQLSFSTRSNSRASYSSA
jgi:hypothetical protein